MTAPPKVTDMRLKTGEQVHAVRRDGENLSVNLGTIEQPRWVDISSAEIVFTFDDGSEQGVEFLGALNGEWT